MRRHFLHKNTLSVFCAFVPLIDSGISVYIWSNAKFASIVIYTCKGFDEKAALQMTRKFFRMAAIESMSF